MAEYYADGTMNYTGITPGLTSLQYDYRTANMMYNWRVNSSPLVDHRNSIKNLEWMRSLAVL